MRLDGIVESMKNYFLGTNINKYYQERMQKHPEQERSLKRERIKYLVAGKAIPNTIDISGIIMAFYSPFAAVLTLGIGEGLRDEVRSSFLYKQHEHVCDDVIETIDKTKETLSKKGVLENLKERLQYAKNNQSTTNR